MNPAIFAFVEGRLAAILEAPDTWGSPEGVELQILLLVELRHKVLGQPDEVVDHVTARYRAFLGERYPKQPFSLAGTLGLARRATPEFVEVLSEFVQREAAHVG